MDRVRKGGTAGRDVRGLVEQARMRMQHLGSELESFRPLVVAVGAA